MTDNTPEKPPISPADPSPDDGPKGERVAKAIARSGLASRRVAERMILDGRVTVNGKVIASPALDILPEDLVAVDGKPLDAPQDARMWLYYKPAGLVTTESDELGRRTIYDELPPDLPRVITVGRLDLNSEGLLLLTNDGELKRRLEMPATGWLRRYRVRVNGRPNDATFDPLRRGAVIGGEEFQPMEISLDSRRGDNAWLTVGIREGRNREIRRAMEHVGLVVNRLIRLSYGPFRLGAMKLGEVSEIRRRMLRDQLGPLLPGNEDAAEGGRPPRRAHSGAGDARPDRPRRPMPGGADRDAGSKTGAPGRIRKPRHGQPAGQTGADTPFRREAAPRRDRADGSAAPSGRRDGGRGAGSSGPHPRKDSAGKGFQPRREDGATAGPRGKPAAGGRRFGASGNAPDSPDGPRHGTKPGAKPGAKPRSGTGFGPRTDRSKAGGFPQRRGEADGKPSAAGGERRGPSKPHQRGGKFPDRSGGQPDKGRPRPGGAGGSDRGRKGPPRGK